MPRAKLTKSVIDALPIPSPELVYWGTKPYQASESR